MMKNIYMTRILGVPKKKNSETGSEIRRVRQPIRLLETVPNYWTDFVQIWYKRPLKTYSKFCGVIFILA
jgi:hypothetical protein